MRCSFRRLWYGANKNQRGGSSSVRTTGCRRRRYSRALTPSRCRVASTSLHGMLASGSNGVFSARKSSVGPILEAQTRHPLEFAYIVRNQSQPESERISCNQQVVGSDQRPALFESG